MPEPRAVKRMVAGRAETPEEVNRIFSLVYEDLRRSAAGLVRRELRQPVTATALVHECWFKMKGSEQLAGVSQEHFKAIAIRAMRQILVEQARRRMAQKRACELLPLTGELAGAADNVDLATFLSIGDALTELERRSERQANVVCLRVFKGETMENIAALLDVSKASVERDWRIARAWLAARMRPQAEEKP